MRKLDFWRSDWFLGPSDKIAIDEQSYMKLMQLDPASRGGATAPEAGPKRMR